MPLSPGHGRPFGPLFSRRVVALRRTWRGLMPRRQPPQPPAGSYHQPLAPACVPGVRHARRLSGVLLALRCATPRYASLRSARYLSFRGRSFALRLAPSARDALFCCLVFFRFVPGRGGRFRLSGLRVGASPPRLSTCLLPRVRLGVHHPRALFSAESGRRKSRQAEALRPGRPRLFSPPEAPPPHTPSIVAVAVKAPR